MKKLFIVIIVLSLTVFVLPTCGGGGPASSIDVTLAEFSFSVSEYTIPRGREITVHATNNGAVLHDLEIFKLGTDPGDHYDDEDQTKAYW